MIKINKSKFRPAVVFKYGSDSGKEKCEIKKREHCEQYDKGVRDFNFSRDIYACDEIIYSLLNIQNYKCCYCEKRLSDRGDGDVEHFRPKGGYKQNHHTALKKPGYYWLAYDWDNLFFSCPICNQRKKGNLFPLKEPNKRALNHSHDICNEHPLLVHVSNEDPADHIIFREEYAVGTTDKGKKTIEIFDLNKESLLEDRLGVFNNINSLMVLISNGLQVEESKAKLKNLISSNAKFLGMIRSNNLDK